MELDGTSWTVAQRGQLFRVKEAGEGPNRTAWVVHFRAVLWEFAAIKTGRCSAEARAVEDSLDEILIVDSCCRSRAGKVVTSRE